jgi:hypothetical protein
MQSSITPTLREIQIRIYHRFSQNGLSSRKLCEGVYFIIPLHAMYEICRLGVSELGVWKNQLKKYLMALLNI